MLGVNSGSRTGQGRQPSAYCPKRDVWGGSASYHMPWRVWKPGCMLLKYGALDLFRTRAEITTDSCRLPVCGRLNKIARILERCIVSLSMLKYSYSRCGGG